MFGSVRRYPLMVLVVTLSVALLAAAWALRQQEMFRAVATVTVPLSSAAVGAPSDQYLSSQVLLLQSPEVADRAARIANANLDRQVLTVGDFKGEGSAAEIVPPQASSPGSYGSSIVTVTFSWPSPEVAQAGANALLQAFDDVRSDTIAAEAEGTVAGIEKALQDARTRGQVTDLQNQRTKALVDLEVDLARHPTVAWAAQPQVPVNGNVKRSGAIGLFVGGLVGAGLAFARASRDRSFGRRTDPEVLYEAPLLGELSAGPDLVVAESYRVIAGNLLRLRRVRAERVSVAVLSTTADPRWSAVVANLALAVADGGSRVLAVDADARGVLATYLLPDGRPETGFQDVLAGGSAAVDCIRPSPLAERVSVLGPGGRTGERLTGVSYTRRAKKVLTRASTTYDLVLVGPPDAMQTSVSADLLEACDAAVVLVGSHEPVEDHLELARRLELAEARVVGYVYGELSARALRGRPTRRSVRSALRRVRWSSRPNPHPRPASASADVGHGDTSASDTSPSDTTPSDTSSDEPRPPVSAR